MTERELINILESPDFNVYLDGGDDSGAFYIEGIENEEVKNVIETLLYNNCNYGSFAGNYSVTANGGWNNEEKAIILSGEEINYESYEDQVEKNITIPISELIFKTVDSVNIYINSSEEECDVRVRVNIKNGRWLKEYSNLEEDIKKEIEDSYDNNYPIAYVDDNYLINNENNFEFSFSMGTYETFDVCIEVTLEEILEQLNIKDE